ncbi:MAG TPA: DUF4189 domain-containing protein [Mycobacterium sp.]|jgi:hypothetical protein
MNRLALAAAAAGVGLSVGWAVPAHAAGTWAAIAYSASSDYWHIAWGPATESAAEQRAIQGCSDRGNDCQIVASSPNCVALADDGSSVHGGVGTTQQAAANDALSRSGAGAHIEVAKCSTDP